MSIEILRPRDREPNYHVVVDGSGPKGHICARGTADSSKSAHGNPPAQRTYDNASKVHALIRAGFLPPTDPILTATHPATDPCLRSVVPTSQDWFFANIPCATVGSTPGAQNTLIIWAEFPGDPEIFTYQYFYGVASAAVECEVIGSGSGLRLPDTSKARPTVALAMAPLVWHLLASGFSAGSTLFNGSWSLSLRQTIGGQCVWDNGGNGTSVPLVELRCESPLSQTWQLAFRYKGLASPKYERPAIDWNTLKPNTIFVRTDNGVDLKTVPQSLTILPG